MSQGRRSTTRPCATGRQGEGVSFTVRDKLAVTAQLDEFGVAYIEGGWPGSNPRDAEFFDEVRKREAAPREASRRSARRSARARRPSADDNVKALLGGRDAGRDHRRQDVGPARPRGPAHRARREPRAHPKSIAYLEEARRQRDPRRRALLRRLRGQPRLRDLAACARPPRPAPTCCASATRAAASLPARSPRGVRAAAATRRRARHPLPQRLAALRVANSLAAVEAGAVQVQGTINGFGERCGNANLCTLIPNLQLKMGHRCVSDRAARSTSPRSSRFCAELANVEPDRRLPYVGRSAFAHKGGLHVAAIQRTRHLRAHRPGARRQRAARAGLGPVGAQQRRAQGEQFGIDCRAGTTSSRRCSREVKELENSGFQFEGADASFELLMRRNLKSEGALLPADRLPRHRREARTKTSTPRREATVMIEGPDGAVEHTAAERQRPGQRARPRAAQGADQVLSRARRRPLHDYKVRVLAGETGTGSRVRVLIESGDDDERWGTVGVSHNVVEASWQALVDSFVYKLHKDEAKDADGAGNASGGTPRARAEMRAATSTTTRAPARWPEARRAPSSRAIADGGGNPSSMHAAAARARLATSSEARGQLAALLGVARAASCSRPAPPNRTTPRCAASPPHTPDATIVTTEVEHHSVLATAAALEREGHRVDPPRRSTSTDSPTSHALEQRDATSPRCLVSIGLANGESGARPRPRRVRAAARAATTVLHLDAAQAAGRIAVLARRAASSAVDVGTQVRRAAGRRRARSCRRACACVRRC